MTTNMNDPFITIQVPITLSRQILADIMCTALEGGIGYWCLADKIERADAEIGGFDYVSFHAYPAEQDDEFPPKMVDYKTIADGIERILNGKVQVNSAIYAAVGSVAGDDADAGNIDAEAADCIVQAGLLNGIVYG